MKTAFNFLACFLLVALSISLTIPARAQDIAPEEEIAYHPLTGLARYIGAPESGRPIKNASALEKSDTFQQAALSFLDQRGAIFGLNDPHAELTLLRESDSSNGNHAVRYQQTYQGIPVLAGEIIIHLDSRKNILSANGEALSKIDLDTTPLIGLDAATQAALSLTAKYQQLDEATLQASPPELWIYNPALLAGYDGPSVLVWRIEVTPRAGLLYPVRQLVLVNAQRGGLVLTFNQIGDARNRLTFNANGDDNEGSLPGSLVCQENEPCLNPPDAAAAHLYAGNTYDFYYNLHGRDSIDNHGMNIISTVNFGLNFENAFWNGDQMVYGAGFASADDVVAHELTHGVTQYESNLFYYWQSGAINESLSDVWGEFVDLKNGEGNDSDSVRWLIGENLPASIGVIRSMKNPPAYLDPDKISSPRYYLGDADSGGVHYNSGVNNKAVYLMTDGDTFNNYTISGIGIEKTAHIYYYVQTNLLTSAADYADLYYAVQTACAALTGTHGITQSDCQQVQKALDAVEMNLQLPSYNPDTSACASPYVAYNHFLDDLENGSANWISEEIVGSQRWAYGSPYGDFSHSGKGFLYADDYPAEKSDTFLRMTIPVSVPQNGKLLFQHAYAFEYSGSTYFDGGVLEYSLNNGSTWQDAGPLIDFNGYKGPLAAGFDNPLGGRQGFGGQSHGYISTRLNLASLAGQSLLFRWRMGLDNGGYSWGWWLDDIQLYECVRFNDVPSSYWAYAWIDRLAANQITSGYPDGAYRPAKAVTRAEMAVFLLKAIHGPAYSAPSTSPTFTDTGGHWATNWIEALKTQGITSGYPDGSYRPDNTVTRAEMAIFLLKGLYGPAYAAPNSPPTFNDAADHWAVNWIEALRTAGITGGYPDGGYHPAAPVSRAEMAVFLGKAFNLP